jgi:hypothetical protein
MRSKFLKAAVGSGIALLVLTGCMDAKSSIDIQNDGTATVKSEYLIQNDYLEQMNMTQDRYAEYLAENATNKNYELLKTEAATGVRYTNEVIWEGDGSNFGTQKDVAAANTSEIVPALLKREGDNILIGIPFYATEEEPEGSIPLNNENAKEAINSFAVSATFPGNVTEANHKGKIDGHTVTWDLDSILESIEAKEMLTATGESGEGGMISFPVTIILIVALLGLAAGGFFLFKTLKRRKTDNDNDDYIDGLAQQHAPAIAELKRQANLEKEQSQTDALKAWQADDNEEVPQTPKASQPPLPPQEMPALQTSPPRTLPPLRMPPKPKNMAQPLSADNKPAGPKLPPLPPLPPRKI